MRGNMVKRLDYLDIAKGILIILVVIGHIWQSGPVFNIIYAFHMPAFFLISGMLLQHTGSYRKPFDVFLKSRLFSFGIPFIFIEFLGCLTDIIRHGVTLNWKGYLYNTLTFHFNDPNLWFLMDLFLCEIMFFMLLRYIKEPRLVVLIVIMLYIISRFIRSDITYIGTVRLTLYFSLFFAVGFFAPGYINRWNTFACLISATIVLLVGILLGKNDGNTLTLKGLAYIISGLCGSYVVIHAGKIVLPEKMSRTLAKIGMNTIIIYGTHHIIYATIGVLLGYTDFGSIPLIPGVIMLLGVTILEIPIIYIINRWVPWLAGKRKRKPSTALK